MGAATLVSMAQRACIRNIDSLKDIGEISEDLIRPILKKITNPEQLREIEDASPHVAEHNAELWKQFIMRDIPDWEHKMVEPKNPKSWGKVYRKLQREERRTREAQEEELRAVMSGIERKREENKTTYVPKVIAEPKRRGDATTMAKPPALKNAKTGKDILNALRKQSSNAQQQRGLGSAANRIIVPGGKSQITKAPVSMVRDHAAPMVVRRPAQMTDARSGVPPPKAFVSGQRTTQQDQAIEEALRAERTKKEERLRALTGTAGRTTRASPPSSTTPSNHDSTARHASTTATSPPTTPHSSTKSPLPTEQPKSVSRLANDTNRLLSPSPAPVIRKRAPVSAFMPPKKRKI